ncbi:hypothetical protein Xsto_01016 [Xenorhabdus stockiae]|uniref:Uncharacterized protein n=1 Tax=Xenorhabdus stockiae TaxID=351614 RepID=A0A2D0KTY6_9GAMM|nr:tail fiber protein [Xenorhabdus stockiae]PHM66687.1 hypothetical protein Xsto_01016 [Xenorhabdus stockiae]
MKEIRNDEREKKQPMLSNAEVIGPKIEELQNKFKEQSIPLQVDFWNLINIADIGRKACGQSPDQSENSQGPGTGLKLDDEGRLNLKIAEPSSSKDKKFAPVILKDDVLSVGLGNGITVDSNGISVDLNEVLPQGMIMMFSGKVIPEGWVLCDGNNGTPDLVNRFIMGGVLADIEGQSSNTFSGDKDSKKFTFESESQTVNIKGKTEGHKLTEQENAKHHHMQGETYKYNYFGLNGNEKYEKDKVFVPVGEVQAEITKPTYSPYTWESGEGEAHSHDINLTNQGAHSHDNNVTVPYYILAFIMKK